MQAEEWSNPGAPAPKGRFTTETQRAQRKKENKVVIPAKAGIHLAGNALADPWIPAFAGMTTFEGSLILCVLCASVVNPFAMR